MDDLCDMMAGIVPVHDPENEYEELQISKSMSISILSESIFLKQSFHRYKRYLRYIDFSIYGYKGELIILLINDFLQQENTNYNKLFLAAKCVIIDGEITYMMENIDDFLSDEY